MKTSTLTLLIAALCAAGCSEEPSNRPVLDRSKPEQRMAFDLNEYVVQGHLYLAYYKGGIIHALHCQCFTNILESYRIDIKPGTHTNFNQIKSSAD